MGCVNSSTAKAVDAPSPVAPKSQLLVQKNLETQSSELQAGTCGRGIATTLIQKLDDLTKDAKMWVSVRVKADAAPQTLTIAGVGVTIGGLLDVFVTKKELSLYSIQVRGGVTVGGLAVVNGPDPLGLIDGDVTLGWEPVGVFEAEAGDQDGVWAIINDLSNGKIPISLTSLQIENGPFAQFLIDTQLSQFTQMAFQGRLVDIKAAVIPALEVTFDASGKLEKAFLKVRCQGDSTVGKFTGLSFLLAAVEGRIIREVTASIDIPSSVNSIQDLIKEVPQSLQYTDSLYVYMWPRSLLGGGFASFEVKTSLSPSEFSQVPVAIAESLADGLAEMGKISESGVSFNYYIAAVATLPTPDLLAQIYGIGPQVSSTVDFLLPLLDKEHFFGLGDIIEQITHLAGAANTSSDAPSHIHTHSTSSSRDVHALHFCVPKANSCGTLSA